MNEIPEELAAILQRERISSLKVLQILTQDDIRDLNLQVGYRSLLRHTLKLDHKYRRKKMFAKFSFVKESV